MSINENNIINIDDSKLKANTPMMQVTVGSKTLTVPVMPENAFTVNSESGNIIDIAESSVLPYTPMVQVGSGNSKKYFPLLTGIDETTGGIDGPLTLTAEEDNVTVVLNAIGSPIVDGLNYRTDLASSWIKYSIGTVISLAKGQFVQFYNSNTILSTSVDDYVNFNIVGRCAASGNIQSMLNYKSYCTDYCYIYMFHGCTSLTKAPALPATTLAKFCYSVMFTSCTSLTMAPELPVTNLAEYCYTSMFHGCTSLTMAPELPATTLAKLCYRDMFGGCTSLQRISVKFTGWGNATDIWVDGVPTTGTFHKPQSLPTEFGTSRIPEGWTVV